jgi:hypothetical protein
MERPVRQHLHRREHQVLLDPPDQVSTGRSGQAPEVITREIPVGQQQHPRRQRGQQPPRQHLLAGLVDTVEDGVDQRVSAALGQREQPDLRVAALGDPERLSVGRGIGRVQPGAIPGHQPQPEREHPRGPRSGQHAAPQLEEQFQRLDPQPLPRPGQRRARRQHQALQMPHPIGEPAHHRPVTRRSSAVRAAEQAQPEHEVHHRPRGQQPPPLLAASGQLDHLIDQARADLIGQHPQASRAC